MAGETNLQRLLASMQPVLNAGQYVFCTTHAVTTVPAELVLGSFRETEGLTLIVARETADAHGLSYDYVSAWLTLNVHSSLAAVGLTAAVAAALARENISCNVVAAYFHDHLFVAQADAQRALAALQAFSGEAGGSPSKKVADR
ncbi:ACT domain-containing protein [Hymenobacter sp. BT770]|uniref:ACT domain-containing protein n=1 Tax=Hymenobacter sp. BT770 TaxID=2886942 RepID=UPI001D11442D|nr:ACT domain-containing protein [Hymenobacter sp. BT770]MCC3155257.1 ACT domain-containing protein [Hymenobacter sp. BT770]MDO3417278.1 ACT domain-containing protein [Hymenobacter sp. BT770]